MRLAIAFFLSLFSVLSSEGQSLDHLKSLENGDFQIRQRFGTDTQLEEWLTEAGVREDTVYAFIYTPAGCPRCEAGLKEYMRYFRTTGDKFILITVLSDKEAAAFYNRRKKYTADYNIYDTDGYFKRIFSFNTIPLNVPMILKLTRRGRLISGYDGMSFTKKLVGQLAEKVVPMDYNDFDRDYSGEASEWMYPVEKSGAEELPGGFTDYRLDVRADAPLGEIFRTPYFTGSMFFYPDEILGSVPLYRQNAGETVMRFVKELKYSDTEKDRFVNVDKDTYNEIAAKEGFYYIICNAGMLDKDHIGLSYSLPWVFPEPSGDLAFYNYPCILSRKVPGLEADTCSALDLLPNEDKYFYKHFQFSSTGSRIIIGCEKFTWKMGLEPADYKDDVAYNSFVPGFYDTETSFMAEFDRRTGKLIRRFGRLDSIAEKTMTGYYYVNPLSVTGGSELAYTDGYSGKVYVADTADVAETKSCYTVFGFDHGKLLPPDTANFYTQGYAKPYRRMFCREIKDIRIMPDRLYSLVAYGDMSDSDDPRTRYTFVTVDRRTGERREYLYPQEAGWTVFTRGLREKDGRVYPFSVLKRGGEALLRVYGEDGAEL